MKRFKQQFSLKTLDSIYESTSIGIYSVIGYVNIDNLQLVSLPNYYVIDFFDFPFEKISLNKIDRASHYKLDNDGEYLEPYLLDKVCWLNIVFIKQKTNFR